MMNAAESVSVPVRGAKLWPLSVAAYHVLGEAGLIPEQTELLYGLVYTKMPKSPLHSGLIVRLLRLLEKQIPPGHLLRPEQPITCGDSEPEPDLSIVRGTEEEFWNEHPTTAELVIEICVTSHEYDRFKFRAYAEAKVKECWLILAPEQKIERYAAPSNGAYTERSVHANVERVVSSGSIGVSLNVADIFSR